MNLFKQKNYEPVIIGTFYTNDYGFKTISELVRKKLPKAKIKETQTDNDQKIEIFIKNGLFENATKITLNYMEKKKIYPIKKNDRNVKPSLDDEDCEVTRNLLGMINFVSDISFPNHSLQNFFLHKISFVNSFFSFILEGEQTDKIKDFILFLASELQAFIFANETTLINPNDSPVFLNKDLKTIVDFFGNSEIKTIDCAVKKEDEDAPSSRERISRKEKSEEILRESNVLINYFLPCVEAECEVTIRTPQEIATRIIVLITLTRIAHGILDAQNGIDYLKKHHLWDVVTSKEKASLDNLTEELKCDFSWEIEKVYVLMWAIKRVTEIKFPSDLCAFDEMDQLIELVNQLGDPSEFIHSTTDLSLSETRSTSEILDMNDLYYRFNWACVDARLNNKEITELNSSVAYMRQFALNWLIKYCDQDWDDVTCDT